MQEFLGSEEETKELISMYINLREFDNEDDKTFAQNVDDLFKTLRIDGSMCYLIKEKDMIAGFTILLPHTKDGIIGRSLYLKEEFRHTFLAHKFRMWLENFVKSNNIYCLVEATNENICKIYDKRYTKISTTYKIN